MAVITRLCFLLFITALPFAAGAADIKPEKPFAAVIGVGSKINLITDDVPACPDSVLVNGTKHPVIISEDGSQAHVPYTFSDSKNKLNIKINRQKHELTVRAMPVWLSIIPPLLAILLALITREVLMSLFGGIFSGAAIIGFYQYGFGGIFSGFLRVFDRYIISALNDAGHIAVIVFSMTIGAVVALISKNGGMQGVVKRISKIAKTPKRGQLATYTLGLGIFFDDYANTLVVGNTMRAVTDKLHISREKLAYIVDSTAAPLAATAFVTTWIGAELGYIEDGINAIEGLNESAYSVFLNSLSYSYYPLFTLFFVLMIILTGKDFGSMFKAESKARSQKTDLQKPRSEEKSEFQPKKGIPYRSFNALIPIFIIVFGTLGGLFYTGYSPEIMQDEEISVFGKASQIIGGSDPYSALLWSSLSALAAAVILSVAQKLLSIQEAADSVIKGYESMLSSIMILVLAWALAQITSEMHTAVFLKSLWSPELSPVFLPAVTFILAALTAFSTGSSWGTMAILYPLLLPASFSIGLESGYETAQALPVFYNVTSCILAGAVLGDHCSPISDTTILSSLASGCNHIDHVRTQLPYALTVGGISILVGTLPAAAGVSAFILFPAGFALIYLTVRYLGKSVDKVDG